MATKSTPVKPMLSTENTAKFTALNTNLTRVKELVRTTDESAVAYTQATLNRAEQLTLRLVDLSNSSVDVQEALALIEELNDTLELAKKLTPLSCESVPAGESKTIVRNVSEENLLKITEVCGPNTHGTFNAESLRECTDLILELCPKVLVCYPSVLLKELQLYLDDCNPHKAELAQTLFTKIFAYNEEKERYEPTKRYKEIIGNTNYLKVALNVSGKAITRIWSIFRRV